MRSMCKNDFTRLLNQRFVFAVVISVGLCQVIYAQKIAILLPEKTPQADALAANIARSFPDQVSMIDNALADSAFRSISVENSFNLSLDEGKRIGSAIGCDAFLIVETNTLRRTSSSKPLYFESYAAIFAVDTRTGHLLWWNLKNAEESSPDAAEKKLAEAFVRDSQKQGREIIESIAKDTEKKGDGQFSEMPTEGSPEAKEFRPPVPYLRIKPEYTPLAYLYDAKGTVEVMVDLDEKGTVVSMEIARWAGFGLDESVIQAVRKMNWRPAERAGKPLPTRFLLRYNFKKIEKD